MIPLSQIFANKAGHIVVPAADVKKIFWSAPGRFQKDNHYTDHVLNTLGISRLNHLKANTYLHLKNPEKVFALDRIHPNQELVTFYGSAGVFVTAYETLFKKKDGLGLLVRDRIDKVAECHADSNVIVAIKGFNNDQTGEFEVTGVKIANLDANGRVDGLINRALTVENVRKAFALADLTIGQISRFEDLTLAENMVKATEILDNPAPKP